MVYRRIGSGHHGGDLDNSDVGQQASECQMKLTVKTLIDHRNVSIGYFTVPHDGWRKAE